MPTKKKSSKPKEGPLTKTDLVNYIGPIFEELKTRIDSKPDSAKMDSELAKLSDKINWQGTLMEQMNKKIDLALELTE